MEPRIAVSKDFLTALSRLPRAQQKKVREFTEKFQRDPTSSGINFERVELAVDPKVRSVRIDQTYRAIIVHPPKGDVYLCVWVDHHDEAYRWVQNKRFEVNPRSGVLQLFDVVGAAQAATTEPEPRVAQPEEPALADSGAAGLFSAVGDEDLLLAGVPEPLLAAVRAVRTEGELDRLTPYLPEDASDVLCALAAGFSFAEAIEEAARAKPAKAVAVDVEDFGVALERPESQQTFRVVSDKRDLEEMLEAPLEQWRIFLHPSQRKLVEMNANGPVRVLGGAGTGKTVVLMHRAHHLARNVFKDEHARILVTTFTRNLALDLKSNLGNLCGDDFERLEVINLHAWAARFLRRHGGTSNIANEEECHEVMRQALNDLGDDAFPFEFYLDEWDRVVQEQDVLTRDDYLTARRTGRGTRLTRRQRADIWKVFDRYREVLRQQGKVEWADVVRESRLYIEKEKIDPGYAAVLSDEVQDFTAGELKLLRTLAPEGPNSLFLVGDGHQRIYGHPVRLSSCGIDIRGRSRRLKLNYRTTEEIRNQAVALMIGCEVDDLDGEADTLKGYRSLRHGPKPIVQTFQKEADEAEFIRDTVSRWLSEGVDPAAICIAARSRARIRDRYQPILEQSGIDSVIVEKDPEQEAKKGGVRLATMHRMKGLEFSRVLLAGMGNGLAPAEVAQAGDELATRDRIMQQRCLVYVAATRARDELVVTGF